MGLRGGGGGARAGGPAPGWTCLLLCAALRSLLASPGSEGEQRRGGRGRALRRAGFIRFCSVLRERAGRASERVLPGAGSLHRCACSRGVAQVRGLRARCSRSSECPRGSRSRSALTPCLGTQPRSARSAASPSCAALGRLKSPGSRQP